MLGVLLGSIATFVTVPFLVWGVVYVVTRKISRKKKFSFMLATDVTTFFLIISVLVTMYTIWSRPFIWPVIILLLLIVIGITFLFWKQDKDVGISHIIKTSWRFNFLLFSSGYLFLCVYGLVQRTLEL
ncbi:DUF3397 domain-containing protein [Pseudalkalibacillus berkeleyi]|uniref:DUF3397 domain-containing protein n=1 Tax=Pseudalkalibacillus berkeleyi TaxID=1069813 RepID=A0ABS9GZT1_9BACL|nr:DUF3397 domain-containing protein [Pseudalkalibacillus berkeleyi]MCF6137003.1 DUF3397 domain-containing protein [Pseudalkalibacillus berkeleyi]